MLSIIWSFILVYWKPVSVILVVTLIIGGVYYKGRQDKQHQLETQAAQETIKRIEEASKVKDKYKKIRDKIEEVRNNPDSTALDDEYSRLLSQPPSS